MAIFTQTWLVSFPYSQCDEIDGKIERSLFSKTRANFTLYCTLNIYYFIVIYMHVLYVWCISSMPSARNFRKNLGRTLK